MTGFWVGTGVLAAVALAFLLVPLWRERKKSGSWSYAALVAVIAIVPAAFALYSGLRTWEPEALAQRAQILEQRQQERELVAQLAAKMAENPSDIQGWRLLGRSYVALGEYAAARRAFEEALRRVPSPDNDLKLSLAEAYVLEDQSTLTGPVGELIEEVLGEEPLNPKALWYGGQRAFNIGDHDAARERLTRLLGLGIVPEDLAQVIEVQLAQLPAGAQAEKAEAANPRIELDISIAEGLSTANFGADSALFIFARAPSGGPPLAALRVPATAIPGQFVLSDHNAMLPGRSLADFPELSLVARLSASGQALEAAGDLYGEQVYRFGDEGARVELVIDKVVE